VSLNTCGTFLAYSIVRSDFPLFIIYIGNDRAFSHRAQSNDKLENIHFCAICMRVKLA